MTLIFWAIFVGLGLLIFIFIKFIHMKHKIYAVLIVLLLLFLYVTAGQVISSNEIDVTSGEGVVQAATIYFKWMAHIFKNARVLAGNAIKMDWEGAIKNTTLG